MFWGFITQADLVALEGNIVGRVSQRFNVLIRETERRLMAKIDEQLAAVTGLLTNVAADVRSLGESVSKIGGDQDRLLEEIANMQRGGLTPEQQASLDNIANLAQSIANGTTEVKFKAQALDEKVPDPAAKPAEVVKVATEAAKAEVPTEGASG